MEPSQPPQSAEYTRPLEPLSPSLGHRPRKTNRKSTVSPDAVPYGGAQRTATTVAHALQQGIESTVTEATRTAGILKDLATRFDGFSAIYDTQQDQAIAKAIAEAVGNTLIRFYQERYGTERAATPPPAPHVFRHVSYAEKLTQKAPGKPQFQGAKNQSKTAHTKPMPKSREDLRVLVTVAPQTTLQREDTYILKRRLLSEIPALVSSSVRAITPTATGWAILLTNISARDELVREENLPRVLKALSGTSARLPEKWFTYAIPHVPTAFISLTNGGERIDVTPELVTDEVFDQTGQSPARCAISRHGINPDTRTATWIVSFKTEVQPFRLFNSTCSSHIIEKRAQITHHTLGCQGWCNPLKCRRDPRCNNCGKEVRLHQNTPLGHQCTHTTKCANCAGPHKAGYETCPAKPRSVHGRVIRPTNSQLRNMRAASAALSNVSAKKSTAPFADTASSQQSQSGNSHAGVSVSRSSSPTPARKRKGAAVDDYERRGSAGNTTTSTRPTRAAQFQGSLNVKDLSDKVREKPPQTSRVSTSRDSSQSSLSSSNPFSPLNPDSPEGAGMEIDTEYASS